MTCHGGGQDPCQGQTAGIDQTEQHSQHQWVWGHDAGEGGDSVELPWGAIWWFWKDKLWPRYEMFWPREGL